MLAKEVNGDDDVRRERSKKVSVHSFVRKVMFNAMINNLLKLLGAPHDKGRGHTGTGTCLRSGALTMRSLGRDIRNLHGTVRSLAGRKLTSIGTISRRIAGSVRDFARRTRPEVGHVGSGLTVLASSVRGITTDVRSRVPTAASTPSRWYALGVQLTGYAPSRQSFNGSCFFCFLSGELRSEDSACFRCRLIWAMFKLTFPGGAP